MRCAKMRTVYAEYAKTSNLVAVGFYLGSLIAAQTAGIGEWPTYLLSGFVSNAAKRVTKMPNRPACYPPVHRLLATSPAWLSCRTASLTQYVAGGVWLKNWADKNTAAGGNPDVGKYLGIYFVFGIGAAALTVLQTLILWIFCSIEVCGD